MEDAELRRYAREAFRSMNPETPHISVEEIAEFAKDKDSNPRRQQIEKHLAECDLCRGRLADFEQFLSDSEQPPERNLTSEWHELQRRIRPDKKTIILWRWLPGAVAAALIVTIGVIWMTRLLSPSPARLLAQAYKEQRTSEFRIAGAAYAPLRVPRGGGSAFALPGSLLKAQAQIFDQLKSNPDNPDLLRLQGEAEMMTHHAADAMRILQRALDRSPQDARILADLGAAYALRGDPGDYSNALENLSQSLRVQPGVAEVVFNQALVLEKTGLFPEAVQKWQDYLQLDSGNGWADEARKHLSDLQQKMRSREERLDETHGDPAKFLALASSGAPFDLEAYLGNYAVTEWLPRSGSDKTGHAAITKLSQMLAQHGDYWLADMAGSRLGPETLGAISSLKTAESAILNAEFNSALAPAQQAKQSFLSAGNLAGSLQARLVEVVILKDLFKFSDCQAAAEKLERDLSPHPYLQLRARVRMEHGICAMRSSQLRKAADLLQQAITISQHAGLGATALEANNRYLSSVVQIGLQSEVFSQAKRCLDIFWAGAYSARLFYQLVDDLRLIATRANQPYTAWFLARSAVWAATEEDHDRVHEASARAYLATRAEEVGEQDEAERNLHLSDQLLAQLPPGYLIEPRTSLAELELKRGRVDSALSRLAGLRSAVPSEATLGSVYYYSVLGEASRRKGLLQEAVEAFHKSIVLGSERYSSMADRERAGVLKPIEGSYRGLVATMLAQGNSDSALGIWQSYRAQDSHVDVREVQSHAVPVLWFIELPDGFISFLTRNGQTTLHRFEISKEAAATVIARFRRECSDPVANDRLLQQDAQQLYRWMIEPLAGQFTDQDESLVFDLDGVFSAVPLQALIAGDGSHLADRFSLTVASGYGSGARQWSLQPNAMAVIVANPAVTGDSAAQFPALSASLEEADIVHSAFPHSKLIQGRAASVANLVSALSIADLVHFVGHGSDWENGALVFTANGTDAGDYELLRSSELQQQDWSRCRLVVLSACAVAKGETTGTHNPDSLVRALTKAGALRVLASSWDVDAAATAEFMKGFYAALATGATPDRALQAAQQSVRRQSGWSHPYYWAGFQLYGTV